VLTHCAGVGQVNDTVKFDLTTNKITDFVKFETGNVCMVTRGANVGRIAVIHNVEHHPGSYDIVHLADRRGHQFSTRTANVFVVGKGDTPLVSIPKGKGIKYSVIEERDMLQKERSKSSGKKAKPSA